MKNVFLYAILFLILIDFSSCKKVTEEYYLTAEEKAMIPFKGYEKITFLSDSNNVIDLIADERVDEIKKYYNDHTESDYILYEDSYINFSNEKYILGLFMSAFPLPPKITAFSFGYVNGNYYFDADFPILKKDDTIKFLDSLLVNGFWIQEIYYDTMEYVHHNPFPEDLLVFPVKSFYSKQYGVVRIDFSDSTSWELESIEW